ncbi:MAG: diguanylate cyclase [Dehalococcoidia bacterium]|nr:diguanylate cyclase [Dehalococcoidia bacterium]
MALHFLKTPYAWKATMAIVIAYWLTLLIISLGSDNPALLPWLLAIGFPPTVLAVVCLWRLSSATPEVEEAHRDDLAGAGNRQAFVTQAKAMLHRAKAGSRALVLVEVEGLKAMNDSCGYQAGDELVLAVAERLKRTNRDFYRTGGDEYALLIDRDKGEAVTATLQLLVPFDQAFTSCGHAHRVSFVYGYASVRKDEAFDGIYRRAEKRLTDLKRQLYASGDRPERRSGAKQRPEAAAEPAEARTTISSLEERRRMRAAQTVS